jgi:hypothetical protein
MDEEEVNFQLAAGGVYRFSLLDTGRYGFVDKPEIVEITEEVAARSEHNGMIYYVDGQHVAEFVDPVTSEHYGQPIETPEEAPPPEEPRVNP